ncbi:MAG: DUF4159 domain-containing protein [candidate division Zixibacteria bacterium]|nr:DUF4159 domain-containing protein [candidate division Zixibacteria bacterium]
MSSRIFKISIFLFYIALMLFIDNPILFSQMIKMPASPSSQVKKDPNAFTIARLKYEGGGDWYWGSSAIPNMLKFLKENTNIPVVDKSITTRRDEKEVRVSIMDKELFNYPFLFLTGHGNIKFSDEEVERLRIYLTHGGFLFDNDSYGLDKAFRREMKKVFPNNELVELPFNHGIYHSYYDFPNGLPKIHKHEGKPAQGFGIFYSVNGSVGENRLVAFYVYESDIGDGWEDPQVHNDPPEKREAALKMGVNIITWVLEN